MTSRPVIGTAAQTLPAVAGERQACWLMGRTYIEALRKVGAVPWVIPLIPQDTDTLQEIFNRLDGVSIGEPLGCTERPVLADRCRWWRQDHQIRI
jgi:putative glutamine amidotransferase